jgi:hypothetical protein
VVILVTTSGNLSTRPWGFPHGRAGFPGLGTGHRGGCPHRHPEAVAVRVGLSRAIGILSVPVGGPIASLYAGEFSAAPRAESGFRVIAPPQ